MRISDWSSDVCSSDLPGRLERAIRLSADAGLPHDPFRAPAGGRRFVDAAAIGEGATRRLARERATALYAARPLMSPSSAGPLRVPVHSVDDRCTLSVSLPSRQVVPPPLPTPGT